MQGNGVVDPTLRQAEQERKAIMLLVAVRWQERRHPQPIKLDLLHENNMARTRGKGGKRRGGMATRHSQNTNDNVKNPTEQKENVPAVMEEEFVTEEDVRASGKGDGKNDAATAGDGAPLVSWDDLLADEPSGDGDLDRTIEEELGEGEKEEEDGKNAGGTEWSVKREDKLIDIFEQCKFLYDKDHPEYKLKGKKVQTFAAFAKKLGMTGKSQD